MKFNEPFMIREIKITEQGFVTEKDGTHLICPIMSTVVVEPLGPAKMGDVLTFRGTEHPRNPYLGRYALCNINCAAYYEKVDAGGNIHCDCTLVGKMGERPQL